MKDFFPSRSPPRHMWYPKYIDVRGLKKRHRPLRLFQLQIIVMKIYDLSIFEFQHPILWLVGHFQTRFRENIFKNELNVVKTMTILLALDLYSCTYRLNNIC